MTGAPKEVGFVEVPYGGEREELVARIDAALKRVDDFKWERMEWLRRFTLWQRLKAIVTGPSWRSEAALADIEMLKDIAEKLIMGRVMLRAASALPVALCEPFWEALDHIEEDDCWGAWEMFP